MTRPGRSAGGRECRGPALWDDLWDEGRTREADLVALAKEEASIRWRRIVGIVAGSLGSFRGLSVIELGAGAGTCGALMARQGARVTLVDYSEQALARAREFFDRNGVPATFLRHDVLCLPPNLRGRFDIAMSFGLIEHFRGPDRLAASAAHFDLLRPGGIALLSVPNRYNPPYRLFKFLAGLPGLSGVWRVGDEHPYSRRELEGICRRLGITEYGFIGDSFLSSWRFVSPARAVKRLLRVGDRPRLSPIRPERGTFLDAWISYALVLWARRSREDRPGAPGSRPEAVRAS
jgi:SAM-dependent methyltransferase